MATAELSRAKLSENHPVAIAAIAVTHSHSYDHAPAHSLFIARVLGPGVRRHQITGHLRRHRRRLPSPFALSLARWGSIGFRVSVVCSGSALDTTVVGRRPPCGCLHRSPPSLSLSGSPMVKG